MAMTLSSFPKLLVVLMWVWDYRDVYYPAVLALLCLSSNAECLRGVKYKGVGGIVQIECGASQVRFRRFL